MYKTAKVVFLRRSFFLQIADSLPLFFRRAFDIYLRSEINFYSPVEFHWSELNLMTADTLVLERVSCAYRRREEKLIDFSLLLTFTYRALSCCFDIDHNSKSRVSLSLVFFPYTANH